MDPTQRPEEEQAPPRRAPEQPDRTPGKAEGGEDRPKPYPNAPGKTPGKAEGPDTSDDPGTARGPDPYDPNIRR
jgi:hypothetical protein